MVTPQLLVAMAHLHFQRRDRFRKIFMENDEFASCCKQLRKAGYDMDLGVFGLGSGKLLVEARLAQRTIEAIQQRCSIWWRRVWPAFLTGNAPE